MSYKIDKSTQNRTFFLQTPLMEKSEKPIKEYIPDFLDYCAVEKGLSENTQKNYDRYLKNFVSWLKKNNKENILPHQLTSEDVWEYRLYLSRSKNPRTNEYLTSNTQQGYLIALRALLTFFAERDILSLPPEKVKLPKLKKEKSVKFLTIDQIEKLLLAPDTSNKIGIRDRAILETLFSTGLRIAELVALNRDQFSNIKDKKDLELGIIGKGGTPRTVYFSERALKWIKKYLDTRNDKDKALFINYRSPKEKNRRLTPRSIERIVKKYAIKAGVPIFTTPHTLRHSYATDLLMQGVDLRTVQEFLGHKNIATTQIYTHITNKRLRDIHRKYHSGNRLKE